MPPVTMSIRRAFELALEHHRAGRLAEAERIYGQILAQEPDEPDALQLLGLIAHDGGRHDEAVRLVARAVALRPGVAEYRNHLGVACWGAGRPEEAAEAYRRALELDPGHLEARCNLGDVLRELGRPEAAADAYREAIRREPGLVEARVRLGIALGDAGRPDEAIAAYRDAIRLEPGHAEAHYHLGFALTLEGRLDQALECYRRAIALRPDSAAYQSQLLQTLHYHPDYDAAAIHREHVRWARAHAEPLARSIPPHPNDPDLDRPLRIGYVSADFRNHACAFCLEPLIARHDRAGFHVTCYAEVARPDDVTRRIESHADAWRNTVGVSDEALAARVRADRIDVLVDLKVHTAENRLMVFARKPAPVQVTWMGYPGTTGLGTVDYRFSDPHLDPPGLNDECYTEETIRLADTFWCYEPGSREPAVNPLPALASGAITFGSLNSFCKVNDRVLELWARVLQSVPGSRFLVLADEGGPRARALKALGRGGVDPARVEFHGRRPRRHYLELYHRVDVALDMFPYSGVTTTMDALLMGVPVVCLAGGTAVSRGGLTIMANVGLPELVARTPDEYVAIAVRLAGDLPRLAALRASLRARLERSPMMDADRFAGEIERALRTAWRRWCAGRR